MLAAMSCDSADPNMMQLQAAEADPSPLDDQSISDRSRRPGAETAEQHYTHSSFQQPDSPDGPDPFSGEHEYPTYLEGELLEKQPSQQSANSADPLNPQGQSQSQEQQPAMNRTASRTSRTSRLSKRSRANSVAPSQAQSVQESSFSQPETARASAASPEGEYESSLHETASQQSHTLTDHDHEHSDCESTHSHDQTSRTSRTSRYHSNRSSHNYSQSRSRSYSSNSRDSHSNSLKTPSQEFSNRSYSESTRSSQRRRGGPIQRMGTTKTQTTELLEDDRSVAEIGIDDHENLSQDDTSINNDLQSLDEEVTDDIPVYKKPCCCALM